jgi:hypothetical protein
VPISPPANDAAYSNFSFNVTSSMGAEMALRVRQAANFANDRFNFDFVTFTNQGYDVVTNADGGVFRNGVQVSVVSNLTVNADEPAGQLRLPAGTSVSVSVCRHAGCAADGDAVRQYGHGHEQRADGAAVRDRHELLGGERRGGSHLVRCGRRRRPDGGELGLTGVVVRIYSASSNLLMTTTSGVAGAYAFTNLPTGSYFLEFVTPTNFLATLQDQGSDALDSDIHQHRPHRGVHAGGRDE